MMLETILFPLCPLHARRIIYFTLSRTDLKSLTSVLRSGRTLWARNLRKNARPSSTRHPSHTDLSGAGWTYSSPSSRCWSSCSLSSSRIRHNFDIWRWMSALCHACVRSCEDFHHLFTFLRCSGEYQYIYAWLYIDTQMYSIWGYNPRACPYITDHVEYWCVHPYRPGMNS